MLDNKVYNSFKINGEVINIKKYGSGNINDTYLVKTSNNKYIVQTINKNVFKKPHKLMKNLFLITENIQKKQKNYNGIKLVRTINNKMYLKYCKKYYRCYEFIDEGTSIDKVNDLDIVYEMGKTLGEFERLIEDIPVNKIYDVIPEFHNSLKRFEDFKKIVRKDKLGLNQKALREILFVYKKRNYFNIISNEFKNHKIRLIPIHNDPKCNNILINIKDKKGVCLIDLDTIMKGSILYDYGDAVRSIILNCNEDECDLENVSINIEKFKYFTKGFLESQNDVLTETEKQLLVDSIIIITLECGMRFLSDFLNGNKYFKVTDEYHNLRRARVAFKEVKLLEKKKEEMREMIK